MRHAISPEALPRKSVGDVVHGPARTGRISGSGGEPRSIGERRRGCNWNRLCGCGCGRGSSSGRISRSIASSST